MKRIITGFLLLTTTLSFSQTTLTTAVDFTVTTTNGQTFNLFSKLDEGKYVLLDFFFTTCPACISTSPYFKEAFENYGCNTQDVYFISIDVGDTDAEVEAYETQHYSGAPIPAASGLDGNGNSVTTTYGIGAWPTYILIAPNRDIVEQDMWPISSAATFDTYLGSHGLTHKSCTAATGVEENETLTLLVYPNPTADRVTVTLDQTSSINQMSLSNTLGQTVWSNASNIGQNTEIDMSAMAPGVYTLTVQTSKGIHQRQIMRR